MPLDRKTCRNCKDYTVFWNQLGYNVYCDTCLRLIKEENATALVFRSQGKRQETKN